jgi:hypothetical protein
MNPKIVKARKQAKLREKRNSYKYLHKKAWDLQSKFIRLGASDSNGLCQCFTCGVKKPWKEMEAGHLWHDRLDFDIDRNIRPQCYQCNVGHSGRREVYSAKLLEKGIDLIKLRRDAESTHYTTEDLKDYIIKYKMALENLTLGIVNLD